MRYKRGDRVKIKSLDWYNQNKDQHGRVACGYHVFTEDMSKFCGCTMIVCNRTNLGVMTMGGSASYWTDEMIEGIADEKPSEKMISLNKVKEWLRNNMRVKTTSYADVWDDSEIDQVVSDFYTIEEMIDSLCKAMEE